jgi:hypothetical protein
MLEPMLEPQKQPPAKVRIIDSLWTFCVAVAFLGPFALPLLWRNPRFGWRKKLAGSIAVLVFTAVLLWGSKEFIQSQYQLMKAIMDGQL